MSSLDYKNMELIDPITLAPIPPILYKYRDSGNSDHLKSLQNLEFYFSSPNKFNDPFDCRIPINYRVFANNPELADNFVASIIAKQPELKKTEKYSELIKSTFINEEWLIEQENELVRKLNDDCGIFCMSEENDNILLWSHYSNNHKGFCLEIDFSKLIGLDEFHAAGPICYTNDYPIISPLDEGIKQIHTQTFYKSLQWAYEKEIRLIKLFFSNKPLKFEPEVIKGIYFGLSISEEQKENLLNICRSNFPGINKYQMTKVNGEFSIKPELIK